MNFFMEHSSIDIKLVIVTLVFIVYFSIGLYICHLMRGANKELMNRVNKASKNLKDGED